MNAILEERCQRYCRHLQITTGIYCTYIDITDAPVLHSLEDPGRFCACCEYENKNELKTHLYGGKESYRWGGKYVYYCPIGLVFLAAPILNYKGEQEGALIMGPIIMGDKKDVLNEITYESMQEPLQKLPVKTPEEVQEYHEVIYACAYYIANSFAEESQKTMFIQSKIHNALYDTVEAFDEKEAYRYPIEEEARLQILVEQGDKEGAQELVNEIISYMYLIGGKSLREIVIRCADMVSMTSRYIIANGADMEQVFALTKSVADESGKAETIDALIMAMDKYIERCFQLMDDFTMVRHADIIHKAMDYVRSHYNEKISLEDVANHVHISRTYLSSIFKQETGSSFSTFVNKIRVEKSQALLTETDVSLADVALSCGFESQSYYTRVFSSIVGMSPKKYREKRGFIKFK